MLQLIYDKFRLRAQPVPGDLLHLTVEGIAACDGGSEDVDNFLRLLPWFAEKELNFEPGPDDTDRRLRVHSHEIKAFLQLPEDSWDALRRLHEILGRERWGWDGGGSQDDFAWHVIVSRDVARFAKVRPSPTTWPPKLGGMRRIGLTASTSLASVQTLHRLCVPSHRLNGLRLQDGLGLYLKGLPRRPTWPRASSSSLRKGQPSRNGPVASSCSSSRS